MSGSVVADDAKVVESASLLPGLGASTPPQHTLYCRLLLCVCVHLCLCLCQNMLDRLIFGVAVCVNILAYV